MWTTNWGNVDLLSIRHDERGKKMPDSANCAGVPNTKRRGNVLFADGHADFVPRNAVPCEEAMRSRKTRRSFGHRDSDLEQLAGAAGP